MTDTASPYLLEANQLAVNFTSGRNQVAAVRQFNLSLRRGESVALVGESGSGKSVSALACLGLLPSSAHIHAERLQLAGVDMLTASSKALQQIRGNRAAMIFQEPMTSLNPLHPIERQIAESLIWHKGLSPAAARQRVLELLDMVGIEAPEKKLKAFPHELSGGQRQRVMIAMAVANEPDLLIADEPTTALDVTIQAQILELIKSLQQRMQMGLLLISHDLGVVRRMADRVLVMRHGEVVESGTCQDVFAAPTHDYTKMLLASRPSGAPDPVADDAPELLNADRIKVWYPIKSGWRVTDHVKAVNQISFRLRAGETLGVVGESGSGKTTLGLASLRLLPADGKVVYLGQDIAQLPAKLLRPLRRNLQIVFQDPYGSLSPRLSAAEIIGEGLQVHEPHLSKQQRDERVVAALTEVGLDPASRHRYPHEFSGGQRQRIAIARAMVLQPRYVVLDEPTSALDMSVQSQIVELLRGLQQKYGLGYLFISHDLAVIRAMAHRVMVMKSGEVVEENSTAAIFTAPQHPYTQKLLAASAAYSL